MGEHDGQALIHASGLVKRFGELVAVDAIDFDLRRGEAFGFLGPAAATSHRTPSSLSRCGLPTISRRPCGGARSSPPAGSPRTQRTSPKEPLVGSSTLPQSQSGLSRI